MDVDSHLFLLFQVLPAFATHGDRFSSRSVAGPAVWSPGFQALARTERPPTGGVGYGDGGWVSAGGWRPGDLGFPLASVRVGVCTCMYSQNKSVPVWEISVKRVFCKSWPGSCFHITNQKAVSCVFVFWVFLGGGGRLCFSKSAHGSASSFTKGKDMLQSHFYKKPLLWSYVTSLSWFGGAGCHTAAWTMYDCSAREGKSHPGGWGPTCKKVSAPLDLTRKGASTDRLDLAVSLPLSLYKSHLLHHSRCLEWGRHFYPKVPEHLRLIFLFSLLPPSVHPCWVFFLIHHPCWGLNY